MTDNKNMLKTNNRVDMKVVNKKKFYGIVEYSVSVKDHKGKNQSVSKTAVIAMDEKTSRIEAKHEIERAAKAMGGKITYFGAFGNQA